MAESSPEFVHQALSAPLSVQEARGLYADLSGFLSVQPLPAKVFTKNQSPGGDPLYQKGGRFRKAGGDPGG